MSSTADTSERTGPVSPSPTSANPLEENEGTSSGEWTMRPEGQRMRRTSDGKERLAVKAGTAVAACLVCRLAAVGKLDGHRELSSKREDVSLAIADQRCDKSHGVVM